METHDDSSLIDTLNRMLAKEHACAIRYATHAALITGPHVDPVSKRLQEIAADEILHAAKLRKRIRTLGGRPTMKVDTAWHLPSLTLGDIVAENIREEREAIEEYREILKTVPPLDVLLYDTLEDILKDEQEHLEELLDLVPLGEPVAAAGGNGAPGTEGRDDRSVYPQNFDDRT